MRVIIEDIFIATLFLIINILGVVGLIYLGLLIGQLGA